jgi:hypothetical protein
MRLEEFPADLKHPIEKNQEDHKSNDEHLGQIEKLENIVDNFAGPGFVEHSAAPPYRYGICSFILHLYAAQNSSTSRCSSS